MSTSDSTKDKIGTNEIYWIETADDVQDEHDNNASDVLINDLFADPDPHEVFTFDMTHPATNENIIIKLNGYKAELGQTLSSTGLTLWRASEILRDYMTENYREYFMDKNVLELGSGLGLCGIWACHLGAKSVMLTDGDSDTLANLRQNVLANCHNNQVSCQQLIWGRNVDDFCHDFGMFDTIIGADIIYIEEIIQPLFKTVRTLLKPHGTFLLAYARRNVKIDLVLDEATAQNFVWTIPDESEGVFVFK